MPQPADPDSGLRNQMALFDSVVGCQNACPVSLVERQSSSKRFIGRFESFTGCQFSNKRKEFNVDQASRKSLYEVKGIEVCPKYYRSLATFDEERALKEYEIYKADAKYQTVLFCTLTPTMKKGAIEPDLPPLPDFWPAIEVNITK